MRPVEIIRQHIEAVRDDVYDRDVAPGRNWTVMSGGSRHSMDVQQAYRFVTQAWDFPVRSATLAEADAGLILADMMLNNGGGWQKRVAAEYRVEGGLIVEASLIDSKAVKNG